MINWGILGAGHIAHRFAKSLAHVEDAKLYAVSRRSMEKAREFGDLYNSEVYYDNNQNLLNDPNIDVVYIALPHQLHLEWAQKALKAGKAVLCEKPAALTSLEMKQIAEVASTEQRFFMEAMKNRFTPAANSIKELIQSGTIGEVQEINTSFCIDLDEASATYHLEPVHGGCLLDIGIYNISLIEEYLGESYSVSMIEANTLPNGVETYVNTIIESDTITATIECGFDRDKENRAIITGSKGTLVIPDFHRPHSYTLLKENSTEPQTVEIPYDVDDFYGEITHVMECLKHQQIESPIHPLTSSIRLAKIVDDIKQKIAI